MPEGSVSSVISSRYAISAAPYAPMIAGDIRPHHILAENRLDAPQNRIVEKGSALNDDIVLRLPPGTSRSFDHLIEGIFNDGIGQSRGDISDGRALLSAPVLPWNS